MEAIKIQKTVNTGMVRESSYGVIEKEQGVDLHITINIREGGNSGSFEMYDVETGGETWYAEGGLWFRDKVLVDYDGVFSLSNHIVEELKNLGFTGGDIF